MRPVTRGFGWGMSGVTGALALGATLLSSGGARADGSRAAAQELFDDARRLMAEAKYSEACPKFADSEKLDPAPGTLLNLAKCYEKNGQSASAWVTYKDAEAVSKRTGHADWAGIARDRAAAIAPKLLKLTITVPPTSEVEGLQLTRDGTLLARSEWNAGIPVDPGTHLIEATAPGTRKWTTTVTVDPASAGSVVTIPQLEVERSQPVVPPPPVVVPETPPAPPPFVAAPSSGSAERTAGYIIGGLGIAGLGVATVFGLTAKSKNDEALEPQNCPTSTLCTPQGLSLTSDARSAATLSTFFFGVGGAAVVAGAVLVLLSPSAASTPKTTASAVHVVPQAGPGVAGMAMVGSW